MHSRFSTLAAAVALALGTSAASAASVDDMFSIRGYGTLGALYSTQDEGDYVHEMYAQDEGVGYSDSVSAAIDSRTALQIDAQFTDRFSAVIQLVSEAVYNNTWDDEPNDMWMPSLEWANLSYRVTDNFTVRGGRVVMPLLMTAEYQRVGYAGHWMRTPTEVYGKVPYTSVDGGDLSYKHAMGGGFATVRAFGGTNKVRREAPLPGADIDMYGAVLAYEQGGLTLRASYADMRAQAIGDHLAARSAQMRTLQSLFASVPLAAAQQAADLFGDLSVASAPGSKNKSKHYALGAMYDQGSWFAMGEGYKSEGGKFGTNHTSGYVSGGLRLDKFTPYASYALTESKQFGGFLSTDGLPPMLAAIANGVNASLQTINDFSQNQSTATLGLRFDVARNFAIKAQYDLVMLPSDSTGMFINRTAEFKRGDDASLFGLSVDFVF